MAFLRSFRGRMLGVVLAVGVAPLALLGLWLTGATARSGETLLHGRLEHALDEAVREFAAAWLRERSELLDLLARDDVRASLHAEHAAAVSNETAPAAVADWIRGRAGLVFRLRARDPDGTPRWAAPAGGPDLAAPVAGARTTLVIHESPFGPPAGSIDVLLDLRAMTAGSVRAAAGAVLAGFDPDGGILIPTPLDPELLLRDRFRLGEDEWLAVRRRVSDPAFELVAAAPLTGFTAPFRSAARQGTLLLLAVAALGTGAALLLTGRLVRSLERLAGVAEAVGHGDLDRRAEAGGPEEVRRLAGVFNQMADNLRSTLAELAERRALAAVGEFAADLAHEVRNPLTSIRLDLQMVEERIPDDDVARQIHARALAEIERLDRTVDVALRAARAGRADAEPVDLIGPLAAAARAAAPAIAAAGASLAMPDAIADPTRPDHVARPGPTPDRTDAPAAEPIPVRGDAGALEQITLNLLLNAAAAVDAGGRVELDLEVADGIVAIRVRDDGHGIPEEDIERVFEPLFSRRDGGTGLGLPIARRLARAHGGDVSLESAPGRGTTATVRLPLAT